MNHQIQQELLAIQNGRELLPAEDVVEFAKTHKESALHQSFDWDVQRAAHQHWLTTARHLIAVHVVSANGERKLVSLSIDRARPGGGYRNVSDVVGVPSLMEIMLDDALRELSRVQAKYEKVKELAPVWAQAEQVRTRRQRNRKGGGPERRPAAG